MGLEILYLLIPVTLLLAVIALGLFVWAVHAGQFDDLETPAIRVLFDDATARRPAEGAGAPDAAAAGAARCGPAADAPAEPTAKRTE